MPGGQPHRPRAGRARVPVTANMARRGGDRADDPARPRQHDADRLLGRRAVEALVVEVGTPAPVLEAGPGRDSPMSIATGYITAAPNASTSAIRNPSARMPPLAFPVPPGGAARRRRSGGRWSSAPYDTAHLTVQPRPDRDHSPAACGHRRPGRQSGRVPVRSCRPQPRSPRASAPRAAGGPAARHRRCRGGRP